MSAAFPILVLLIAGFISGFYLLKAPRGSRGSTLGIGGDRPWRRIGAAICLLVAVMYVAGIIFLDAKSSPRSFAFYWITILLLILWLCALALKDLWHTKTTIARWRAGQSHLDGTPIEKAPESDRMQ